jgi:uncharacterized membrane protein
MMFSNDFKTNLILVLVGGVVVIGLVLFEKRHDIKDFINRLKRK